MLGWERLGAICNDEQADAATNTFWDSVVHHRSVSIGAHSVSEHFHPTDDFSSMIESREGPETCNSYNMSKLAERLWLRSGSADYINFYERVLENHLLSTINPSSRDSCISRRCDRSIIVPIPHLRNASGVASVRDWRITPDMDD